MTADKSITEEVKWRHDLLAEIGGEAANHGVESATLRDWRIYGGQQGIWVDKQRTASLTNDGNGLAMSLLHKGTIYPDDFDETGVIYHYPVTNRPHLRDVGEIEAVKNCHRLRVPVFVITMSEVNPSKRNVYFGYVTMSDDRAKVFIVEFGKDQESLESKETEKPFELKVIEPREKYEAMKRPDQAAFRISVIRRYGAQCAVCDMAVIELLDAAHLVSKAEDGTDDSRNGLPLCVLHHRAFDKSLFSIRPDTGSVVTRVNGPSRSDLGITRDSISHLRSRPHQAALDHCWENWLREWGST
jgi:putative restriction endonuclease